MRTRKLFVLFALFAWFACPLRADAPQRMNFQGRLIDPATKDPRDGSFSMTFRICNSESGDCSAAPGRLWFEPQTVQVANGMFAVQLGSVTVIPASVFSSATTYLEIEVAGETLGPRERLVNSPYAFRAHVAEDVKPGIVFTFTSGTITGALTIGGAFSGAGGSFSGNLSTQGNLDADGVITAGSGNEQITTAAGLLDASKLSGSIPSASLDTSSVTKQGNSFNAANQLVKLDANGTLNANASGGSIYSVAASSSINTTGGKIREGGNDLIPAGAIVMSLGSCWPGWTEMTQAQGRFIVGVPSGGTVSGTVGSAMSDLGALSHAHADGGGTSWRSGTGASAAATDHTPPYIQVRFCLKS